MVDPKFFLKKKSKTDLAQLIQVVRKFAKKQQTIKMPSKKNPAVKRKRQELEEDNNNNSKQQQATPTVRNVVTHVHCK